VTVEIDELRAVVAAHPPDARMAVYLAKVRERAWQITDADVQAVRDAGATEDEIFEQTVATAISEGLRRLDAAQRVVG
jgi:hypothetical protein